MLPRTQLLALSLGIFLNTAICAPLVLHPFSPSSTNTAPERLAAVLKLIPVEPTAVPFPPPPASRKQQQQHSQSSSSLTSTTLTGKFSAEEDDSPTTRYGSSWLTDSDGDRDADRDGGSSSSRVGIDADAAVAGVLHHMQHVVGQRTGSEAPPMGIRDLWDIEDEAEET